jgi:Protein of unknown function (DUF2868).
MKQLRLPDLIDLEFFFTHDEDSTEELLGERDREIYLHAVQPYLKDGSIDSKSSRREAIRRWLDQMQNIYQRDSGVHLVLPGEAFNEAYRIIGFIISVIGIICGASLAVSMLTYDGIEPINVSVYFGVLIMLQVLFILLTLRFFFIRSSAGRLKKYSVIYPLLGSSLMGVMRKLSHRARERLSARQEQKMEAVFGIATAQKTLYSPVLFWSLFGLIQAFGVFFNLGVIGGTLVRVFTADLAFGWQSTLQVSSQAVHTLIQIFAAPWAWIVPPGIAYPSLNQIEGSRMVLKEGIYHLLTPNLVSWWPFLVLAVCAYGLLPRIILTATALLGKRHALAGLDFAAAKFDRLIMRMVQPRLTTAGAAENDHQHVMDENTGADIVDDALRVRNIASIVLMPTDLMPLYDRSRLTEVIAQYLGWHVSNVLEICGEASTDQGVMDSISDALKNEGSAVVLLQEAWQPPIIEIKDFIKTLRRTLGQKQRIAILLIGKPEVENIFTRVDAPDKEVWYRSLRTMGDPYLRLESMEESG